MLPPSSSTLSLPLLASYGPPGRVVYPYTYSPFGTPSFHHRGMLVCLEMVLQTYSSIILLW